MSLKSLPVLGSLLADSHALPSHWVYDTSLIASKLPIDLLRTKLFAPTLTTYHKSKQAGDFTHYGDQTVILLDALTKPFDVKKFEKEWTLKMGGGYKGYLDHATRETLSKNQGSSSSDISGASRIAPLLLVSESESEFVKNAVDQTRMTHNCPEVIGTAAFAAHALWRLTHSTDFPSTLFPAINKELSHAYPGACKLIQKGLDGNASMTSNACSVDGALPIVIALTIKHEKGSLMDALVANTLLGGDTAARAMLIGAFVSVRSGVPEEMLAQIKEISSIRKKIAEFE